MIGLVLMGGENSRMDGAKKALLKYNGRFFYEHIACAMRGAGVEKLYASVEKNWEMELGMSQIVDRYDKIGPLGGIVTALETLEGAEDSLLVCPCDLPFMSPVLLGKLLEVYEESRLPAVVMQKDRVNPLIAVYTMDCLPVLKNQIAQNNFRAAYWTTQIPHREVVFETLGLDEEVLANINTKEAYQGVYNG